MWSNLIWKTTNISSSRRRLLYTNDGDDDADTNGDDDDVDDDDDDNDHHLLYSPTHCTFDQGGDALELKSTTAASKCFNT